MPASNLTNAKARRVAGALRLGTMAARWGRRSTLLLIAAFPAIAADVPRQPEVERRNDERAMENFARCVVDTMPRAQIAAFLSSDPFSRDGKARGSPLATKSRCLHGYREMFFSPALFRSVLFEALYRKDYASRTTLPAPDQPALDLKAEIVGAEPVSPILLAERSLGDCVVRRKPDAVRTFLLADLYGRTEDSAIAALAEPLSSCTNVGQRLAFSRPVLRGILAEALYRLSAAASGSTGPTGGSRSALTRPAIPAPSSTVR